MFLFSGSSQCSLGSSQVWMAPHGQPLLPSCSFRPCWLPWGQVTVFQRRCLCRESPVRWNMETCSSSLTLSPRTSNNFYLKPLTDKVRKTSENISIFRTVWNVGLFYVWVEFKEILFQTINLSPQTDVLWGPGWRSYWACSEESHRGWPVPGTRHHCLRVLQNVQEVSTEHVQERVHPQCCRVHEAPPDSRLMHTGLLFIFLFWGLVSLFNCRRVEFSADPQLFGFNRPRDGFIVNSWPF